MSGSQNWRALTWRDIPQLVELEERLFPQDAWRSPVWWAELAARPRREYAVVEEDGRIIGYAGLDHGGDVADVMTVGVAPTARGRGLGSQLVRHLLARAQEEGARHVLLEVRADNRSAVDLYRAHGFGVISSRRRYYQPGDVDALVMRRDLPRTAGPR